MIRRWAPVLGVAAALGLLGCQDLKPIKGKPRVAVGGGVGAAAESGGAYGHTGTTGPKVKVELFIMSKCPHGARAAQAFSPIVREVGDRLDFSIDYIVSEQNGQFKSLHGPPEWKGNIIQLCAMKHYPTVEKWMSFLDCQNKTWRQIPQGWEQCATQVQMDVGKMKSCYEGSEGKGLLRASMKKAQARRAGASPTIYIGGEAFRGQRSRRGILSAVCAKMQGQKPKVCADIPPPPKPVEVDMIVLNDKRCKKCITAGLEANLRGRFFPKLKIRRVDYSSEEGKKLFKEHNLKMLPVYLFADNVQKSPKYARISRWLIKSGKLWKLRVPAKHDPTAEICDNKVDDTGNGKVDCDDPSCKEALECRKEKKNRVDVFIMSQCPFGVKAVDAMKEVLANFQGKLDFDVHYIATVDPKQKSGFKALHGDPEVRENIRQLCAKKYYKRNNKYLDYMWCRNKDNKWRTEDWKPCATGGISMAKIEKCSTGPEGKKLLTEDIKLAGALKISGSPTWLANNRYKFSGIVPDAIKTQLCRHNKGLPNCDKKLTSQPPRRRGGGGGSKCGG